MDAEQIRQLDRLLREYCLGLTIALSARTRGHTCRCTFVASCRTWIARASSRWPWRRAFRCGRCKSFSAN